MTDIEKQNRMVNLKQLFLFFALLLSGICTRAQGISHIEATKSWYYIYDQNGKKTKTLSTSIGELQGFSASIFVVKSGSWYYVYDAKGNKLKALSAPSVGKVLSVSGETFTSQAGSWIIPGARTARRLTRGQQGNEQKGIHTGTQGLA